ncbi:MAG: hypothetical protein AAF327_03895 [Cyanobacteria bacterium P01_A01_bin.37]
MPQCSPGQISGIVLRGSNARKLVLESSTQRCPGLTWLFTISTPNIYTTSCIHH